MSIPEDKQEAVARALRSAFGVESAQSVSPVSGGLSGAGTWRIGVNGGDYLLRIEAGRDELRDPHRQYACLAIASDAEVAPRLHYSDAETGVAIVDFVRMAPLHRADPDWRSRYIASLGETLGRLHAAPVFPALMDYMDGVAGLIDSFLKLGILEERATEELFARYAEIHAAYPRTEADQVASHNDLNGRNVLWDGTRVWFVDWEVAFRADRYGDLASLANLAARTPEEEALLTAAYFGRPASAYEQARLTVMRQVNHVFYGMVMLNYAAAEQPGVTYRGATIEAPPIAEIHAALGAGTYPLESFEGRTLYGRSRLNAALDGMKAPGFAEALRAIAS